MSKKETDGKLYKVYRSQDSHINTKVNEDGRKFAIQFDNKHNRLKGPVEIEEVDIHEIMASQTPREINPYVQLILDEVVAPTLRYWFELGTNKLLSYLSESGIPLVKQKIKNFSDNKKIYFEGIKYGLADKETKASKILHQVEENKSIEPVELKNTQKQIFDKEFHSPEEIQQVIDTLKKSVFVTATCIRNLTNAIVFNDGTDSEKLETWKKQLEELCTKEVINHINLILEKKNADLLDEQSYQVLAAFSQGNLLVGGKSVPIAKYINTTSALTKEY